MSKLQTGVVFFRDEIKSSSLHHSSSFSKTMKMMYRLVSIYVRHCRANPRTPSPPPTISKIVNNLGSHQNVNFSCPLLIQECDLSKYCRTTSIAPTQRSRTRQYSQWRARSQGRPRAGVSHAAVEALPAVSPRGNDKSYGHAQSPDLSPIHWITGPCLLSVLSVCTADRQVRFRNKGVGRKH